MPARKAQETAGRPSPKSKTVEFRRWRGVNLTDARTDIEDEEFFWLENAVTVGKGSAQIVPGPGAAVATLAQGIATLWGFVLNGAAVMIAVGKDGSLTQVTPGGATTVIRGAGTVSTAAHLAIWQSSPILILDPQFGYMSWDGVTFTVISATQKGNGLAVFEGRVWLFLNRTITVTSPNTFNDFNPANGSTSAIITDEAFPGNVNALVSALEQLWTFGQAAVDAIANVVASGAPPNVVTTFSITNIVTNIGTNAPNSVIGYLRALTFLAPFGVYALSGVTPQKLSEKLDQMFPALTLTGDVPAAVGIVQSLPCLVFLVTYTQALAPSLPIPANGVTTGTQLLLCFTQGKWFFATQGPRLQLLAPPEQPPPPTIMGPGPTWITTVIVNGVSQIWATDGTVIYQCFGGTPADNVPGKIVSKFYSFGPSTTMKQALKAGFEYQASRPIPNAVLTIDSNLRQEPVAIAQGNVINFTNTGGGVIQFLNAAGQPINFVAQGLVLTRTLSNVFGHYLGWTYTFNDPPHRVQAVQLEYVPSVDWRRT